MKASCIENFGLYYQQIVNVNQHWQSETYTENVGKPKN